MTRWYVIFGFCTVHSILGCSTTTFFFFCDTSLSLGGGESWLQLLCGGRMMKARPFAMYAASTISFTALLVPLV
ncbi:uncharacterized protein F5891DRAFT_1034480 [Suillus fuscotomentosus]|uniref:Uncharacterized protein n=1 Tax=Suillus fuscotomentosus TaxID=1912939 RepID=A0AAD4HKT2_9AGAM|nr:uncharacterized protein F5891DRAFT_1034480 [Suillus fuscotomentosus]KAG1900162.1 hypothetical protein F5891DRAFT_1034480 [Suillus fuscotomentosus]